MSHVIGRTDTPLITSTIGQFFDQSCTRFADNEAIVIHQDKVRLTYKELQEQVNTLACSLLRLGLLPGDRVGIWSPNNLEWLLMQFATAKAGLILVNINQAYQQAELEYAINKVGCRALVLAPGFKSSNYLQILSELKPALQGKPDAQDKLPSLEFIVRLGTEPTNGMMNFASLMVPPSASELEHLHELGATFSPRDPVNIQFTSGTTGAAKGATLCHSNILNNGFFVGETIKLTHHDRVCIPVPLYHCFGMVMGNIGCMTHGSTMVYPSEAFDAESVLDAVTQERCTALYGVPTMFIALLDHPHFSRSDFSSLRTGIMAGSPCPAEIMKRVIEKMHMSEVTICYGMTETSPVSFQSHTDAPVDRRVSTVGTIHPHCEVKIVDSDGHTVPRGHTGELCTRGYSVMLGYWGDEEKTLEVIDDEGWMHTGDLATIDEEGYCNIVGRIKDMIIRGGENLYPREIEEFLYRHPEIKDVQVVGVSDQKFGEELCAWVILQDNVSTTEDDIRNFCRGQISHHKIPRYIRFVDEFPLTVTGKVQKFRIRDHMEQELGQQTAQDLPQRTGTTA
ncbi:AMP-binding protein [Alcaligenaceae bacterium 429]|nr:AMP-binding protein [Alcaligenaceae bacterium 429]